MMIYENIFLTQSEIKTLEYGFKIILYDRNFILKESV